MGCIAPAIRMKDWLGPVTASQTTPVYEAQPLDGTVDAHRDFLKNPVHVSLGNGMDEPPGFDLIGIMSAVQETAYLWDLATDRIKWESNASEVLDLDPGVCLDTGSDFNLRIAPEHIQRRLGAIVGAQETTTSKGAHYRVQYRFTPRAPGGRSSMWLEEHGRCWFNEAGEPIRARGIVRVTSEGYLKEQGVFRSDHDELTGQLNRIRLTEALGATIARAQQNQQSSAFLIAAVSNLGVINETFGFDVGDELIAATARIIRGRLRSGDTIGRYSSNKFGIVLNGCGPVAMRAAAERFMKAVREATIRTVACQLSATVSVGGVLLPEHATTAHQALSRALQAYDKAKNGRPGSFMSYEPSASRETTRQRSVQIADQIISALDENRVTLALQPIISMETRQPVMHECLLRIVQPDGSIACAGEFIPIAEQIGLARLIDRRTLELAVGLLKSDPTLRLALNVSGLTASDREWLLMLHRLTSRRPNLAERLTIEITETAVVSDLDISVSFVDALKELGCRVAIDDFGAGNTSFKSLKALRVDMVKIDGSFVKNLITEPANKVFIKTLVEIAETFGLETVAEWVTDEETAQILAECRVTHMQGFCFGRPVLASDFDLATRGPALRLV